MTADAVLWRCPRCDATYTLDDLPAAMFVGEGRFAFKCNRVSDGGCEYSESIDADEFEGVSVE